MCDRKAPCSTFLSWNDEEKREKRRVSSSLFVPLRLSLPAAERIKSPSCAAVSRLLPLDVHAHALLLRLKIKCEPRIRETMRITAITALNMQTLRAENVSLHNVINEPLDKPLHEPLRFVLKALIVRMISIGLSAAFFGPLRSPRSSECASVLGRKCDTRLTA